MQLHFMALAIKLAVSLRSYRIFARSYENEHSYLKSRVINHGVSYQLNNYMNLSVHQLHGSQISATAQVIFNPVRPPFKGGKELAPVPMRLRGNDALKIESSDKSIIKKVLTTDQFEIHTLRIEEDTVTIVVSNNKFRSIAQAVGRVASTLQRFTSDDIKFANISFYSLHIRNLSRELGKHHQRSI